MQDQHSSQEIDAWVKNSAEGAKWSKTPFGRGYFRRISSGLKQANAAVASGTATPSSASSAPNNQESLDDIFEDLGRRLRASSGI